MNPTPQNDVVQQTSVAGKPGRLKALAGKLLLVLFGLLIGALLAEVMLRVAGFSYPEFYQPDATRGYALRPGKEGWYMKEGKAFVSINSDGLRDREHPFAKPPGTFRIALVGDSYPEAFPVDMKDAFWVIMERKLQECGGAGGKAIEVINFGVSGYGTAQELITLREQVWKYSPDLVVLTVTTNNDISDNVRVLKKTNRIPYFTLQDGKLTLDDSFKRTRTFQWRQSAIAGVGRWFEDHLRVVQAIERAQLKLKIWLTAKRAAPVVTQVMQASPPAAVASEDELGVDNVIYREPASDVWQNAWQVTEALMTAMRDEVQSHNAAFLVVTLSNGIQVYPNQEVRQGFQRRLGVPDLFYPDKRIESFCRAENIPVITLAPALQSYADQNQAFLHGFPGNIGYGHWNQLGHRVAGEMIAQDLCRQNRLR
ncbi:MAG: hypothetical protein QOD75_3149 [Blastocatellia bacterium]|jgi:hypothetical protein|nr:hypothetical protein [Blastocatellia bacterium]